MDKVVVGSPTRTTMENAKTKHLPFMYQARAELAKRGIAITAPRIRRFEQWRLMEKIERTPKGYRLFTESDLNRTILIIALQELGMSFKEMQSAISVMTEKAQKVIVEKYLSIFEGEKERKEQLAIEASRSIKTSWLKQRRARG